MRLSLLVAIVCASWAAAEEPVSIAILRQDGYLVPVAAVDGDRYQPLLATSTQLENTNVFTPAAVAIGRTTWKVARRSGDVIEVTTLNRQMVDDHCSVEETWRTSFKGTRAPRGSADIEKIGIAVKGAEPSQPENVTAVPDGASRRVAQLAKRIAADLESKRKAEDPKLLSEYRDVEKAALVVTKLFRHAQAGVTTYFFETAKAPMPLVTSGWIVDSGGELKLHSASFGVNDDGYKEGNDGTVTGLVVLPGRALWLMEWHGYEGEHHAIHEWPSGRVRLATPGTGC